MDDLFPVNQPAAVQPVEATNEELIMSIIEGCSRILGRGKANYEDSRHIGKQANRLKARLGHGQFLKLAKDRFPVPERTLRDWMKKARHEERQIGNLADLAEAIKLSPEDSYDDISSAKAELAVVVESELEQGLPQLRNDVILSARTSAGGVVEIIPIDHAPGYFYVAHYLNIFKDDNLDKLLAADSPDDEVFWAEVAEGEVFYLKRGILLNAETWPGIKETLRVVTITSLWKEDPIKDERLWYINADKLAETRRRKVYELLKSEAIRAGEANDPLTEVEKIRFANLEAGIKDALARIEQNAKVLDRAEEKLNKLWEIQPPSPEEKEHFRKVFLYRDWLRGKPEIQLNDAEVRDLEIEFQKPWFIGDRVARIKRMHADLQQHLEKGDVLKQALLDSGELNDLPEQEQEHFEKMFKLQDWLHGKPGIEMSDAELCEIIESDMRLHPSPNDVHSEAPF